MKVNQTFPKQMKDSDQEQLEDEAGVLRVAVIRSSPRRGCASRFLPWKTGYCSSAAPGKPLSTSSWPRYVMQPEVGYQGKAALGVPGVKMAEQKWLFCHASIQAWCCSKEAVDQRSMKMFELQGLHMPFTSQRFFMGLKPGLQSSLMWQAKVVLLLPPLILSLHKRHQDLLSPEQAGGSQGSSWPG